MVNVGQHVKIGRASVERTSGSLKVKDGYSNREYVVDDGSRVELVPVPPFYVPQKVCYHLMIELENPIVVRGSKEAWVEGPYEIAVRVDGKNTHYLTPVKVKYTLYGDPVEGVVCRYFKSRIYDKPRNSPELASANVVFRSKSTGKVDRFVMHGAALTIFEKDDRYYYEVIYVNIGETITTVTLTDKPPVRKAREVHKDEGILKSKFEMRW